MIPALSRDWLDRAWARQNQLTKPLGSLGQLEEVGVRLAALQQTLTPNLGKGAVVVCAADHGVAAEGVSAYPASVTAQMVRNFLAGGAAINQIARALKAQVYVLDVGVNAELAAHPQLIAAKVAYGSANFTQGPAMTPHQAQTAWQAGYQTALRAIGEGATLLAAGDMGIGNTTAAAALTAALLGLPAEAVTGQGTGVDQATWLHKVQTVQKALDRAQARCGPLHQAHPMTLLAELGGLELAAIAGVYCAAAQQRVPGVLDGFPVTVAAFLACRLEPHLSQYLFAGHLSQEPGHGLLLQAMGLQPLLQLGLRLGEGTGAVLAFSTLRAAARLMAHMSTFQEAGLDGANPA